MKKKGFTLIEVMASLSIILIIFSLTISVKDTHSIISNEIQWKSTLYEVENLLSYSKAYCKKNEISGEIQINDIINQILFLDKNRNIIKNVVLPKEIKIITPNKCMQVKSDGGINKGKTIVFTDNKNNFYKITVATGIDYISISEV